MLKKSMGVVMVLLWVLCAAPVGAQGLNLYGALDRPQPDAHILRDHATLQGWALNCATGRMPSQAIVYLLTPANGWAPVSVAITWWMNRPDVRALFAPYCAVQTDQLGFRADLLQRLPEGRQTLAVVWGDPGEQHLVLYMAVTVETP